jgi:hypothetical protein
VLNSGGDDAGLDSISGSRGAPVRDDTDALSLKGARGIFVNMLRSGVVLCLESGKMNCLILC